LCNVALNKERIIMRTLSLTAAVLAAGLAFTFTGCGSKDSEESSETVTAKYTTAELAEKITVCGHQLNSPMTFADLGDDFFLDSYVQESSTSAIINIFDQNGIVCALEYHYTPDDMSKEQPDDTTVRFTPSDFEGRQIDSILFTPNDFNRDAVSIDGFTANDGMDVLEEKLGEPTSKPNGLYVYDTTDGGRLEVLEAAGKIFSINFYLSDPENSETQNAIYR